MENPTLILISADVEWSVVRGLFPLAEVHHSPYGEWFPAAWDGADAARSLVSVQTHGEDAPVIVFHGGWGKIAAAASAQYALDRWKPGLLVNLGTCGGFAGRIERGSIILVEKTIVYDIIEQMGEQAEHIAHYTSEIDLSWLTKSLPPGVQRGLLVSGDRDLLVEDIPRLVEQYHASAGDWESGAIAWVAGRNQQPLLILRGVTDLVAASGGEAYGGMEFFTMAAQKMIRRLFEILPLLLI